MTNLSFSLAYMKVLYRKNGSLSFSLAFNLLFIGYFQREIAEHFVQDWV